MIGMVNAIGAGQAVRDLLSTRSTGPASPSRELGEPPMWVRPHDPPPSPTESTRAVRPVEFQEAQSKAQSSEEARVPEAPNFGPRQSAPDDLGQVLDTTG